MAKEKDSGSSNNKKGGNSNDKHNGSKSNDNQKGGYLKDNHKADQSTGNNTTLDHNNEAYKKATDNHADQKNPNNPKGKKK